MLRQTAVARLGAVACTSLLFAKRRPAPAATVVPAVNDFEAALATPVLSAADLFSAPVAPAPKRRATRKVRPTAKSAVKKVGKKAALPVAPAQPVKASRKVKRAAAAKKGSRVNKIAKAIQRTAKPSKATAVNVAKPAKKAAAPKKAVVPKKAVKNAGKKVGRKVSKK